MAEQWGQNDKDNDFDLFILLLSFCPHRSANSSPLSECVMPIEVDSEIRDFDRDEFHSLAHRILGIAFDVHNEFGRLLDESIYKQAISLRCAAAGILPARQEVQIVSTTLNLAERRRFTIHDLDWRPINEPSRWLRETIARLLADWGAFLQVALYRQAIIHFLGGPEVALRKIPILDGDESLGFDEVCLLCDDTALAFTALTDGQPRMRDHLQRFLDHTRLACIQWINLNHHDIEFTSLVGSGRTMGAGR